MFKLSFLAAVVLASCSFVIACHSEMQKTSVDIGNGMRKGDPPMCFQYRGESRPTNQMGLRHIFAHVNNTCSFPVDCMVWDDVSEQEHRVALPGYRQYSFILAANVTANRVDMKFDCTWKP